MNLVKFDFVNMKLNFFEIAIGVLSTMFVS